MTFARLEVQCFQPAKNLYHSPEDFSFFSQGQDAKRQLPTVKQFGVPIFQCPFKLDMYVIFNFRESVVAYIAIVEVEVEVAYYYKSGESI